eukprot:COSAG06_NODE_47842_length_336_cov_1.084388_1_plen_26_part_01
MLCTGINPLRWARVRGAAEVYTQTPI